MLKKIYKKLALLTVLSVLLLSSPSIANGEESIDDILNSIDLDSTDYESGYTQTQSNSKPYYTDEEVDAIVDSIYIDRNTPIQEQLNEIDTSNYIEGAPDYYTDEEVDAIVDSIYIPKGRSITDILNEIEIPDGDIDLGDYYGDNSNNDNDYYDSDVIGNSVDYDIVDYDQDYQSNNIIDGDENLFGNGNVVGDGNIVGNNNSVDNSQYSYNNTSVNNYSKNVNVQNPYTPQYNPPPTPQVVYKAKNYTAPKYKKDQYYPINVVRNSGDGYTIAIGEVEVTIIAVNNRVKITVHYIKNNNKDFSLDFNGAGITIKMDDKGMDLILIDSATYKQFLKLKFYK